MLFTFFKKKKKLYFNKIFKYFNYSTLTFSLVLLFGNMYFIIDTFFKSTYLR